MKGIFHKVLNHIFEMTEKEKEEGKPSRVSTYFNGFVSKCMI